MGGQGQAAQRRTAPTAPALTAPTAPALRGTMPHVACVGCGAEFPCAPSFRGKAPKCRGCRPHATTELTFLNLAYKPLSGRAISGLLVRHTQLETLILDPDQNRAVSEYCEANRSEKLLALAMGLQPRLGADSPAHTLGNVRGDRDGLVAHDVPIFRIIAEMFLELENQEETRRESIIIIEGSEHINLKVKGQDGIYVHFKIKKKTQLKKLMEAYCARQSLQMDQIRFLFDGRKLYDADTPDELDMEDGDVIDSFLYQVGGCIAAPIPSTFGLHLNTPGVAYLQSSAALTAAAPSEAVQLMQQLGGDPTARPCSRPDRVLLAPEQRRALISVLDDTHSAMKDKSEDLRMTVTAEWLEALIGREALRMLVCAFGEQAFDTIKLRRVEAHGLCVPFHTDYSRYEQHCARACYALRVLCLLSVALGTLEP